MRRRTLVALVLVTLLVVGGAPRVSAGQGRGAIQFELEFVKYLGFVKYLEGRFSEPLVPELPGGRQLLSNPDGWWAECHAPGLAALDGWYIYVVEDSIRQPGGALQFSGTWEHWEKVPVPDPSQWFFVELPEVGVGDGWTKGWWSGTFQAVLHENRPFAVPPYGPDNYPQYMNMSFTIQGHGHGAWEGWTIRMNTHIRDANDLGAGRTTGHITPPKP